MTNSAEILFKLLRIALGKENDCSLPIEIQWNDVIDLSFSQNVAAIAIDGLQKIYDTKPELEIRLDRPELEEQKYKWFGSTFDVEKRNHQVNHRAKELYQIFADCNFRSCILKGQGIASYYPIPDHRQSGDIDLWVEGDRDEIITASRNLGVKIGHIDVKHSDMDFFPDVPVEIHFNPSYSYNPFIGKKIQRWTDSQAQIQFSLFDGNKGYAHPSIGFNLVYILLHIYRHLFSEGVGLRQVVDYYCVLHKSDSDQRNAAFQTLYSFKLQRFTAGLMWVLKEIFHIDEPMMLCPASEKEGRFLLNEFMLGAGFGRYDERNSGLNQKGYFKRGVAQFKKNLRFVFHYPQEVLWSPFWKLWHWCWRKKKGYLCNIKLK